MQKLCLMCAGGLGYYKSMTAVRRHPVGRAGEAGIEWGELGEMPSASGGVCVTCIDYGPGAGEHREEVVNDVAEFLGRHRPEWSRVRWINVDGLTDMGAIRALAEKYGLHPLAVEDVLNAGQRPKVDRYEAEGPWQARLFISARMVKMDGGARSELVSILEGHKTILTFQATRGDAWEEIRRRIAKEGTRVRRGDASFLAYSLIDAMVDRYFPLLEHYGERMEELEQRVLEDPDRGVIAEVFRLRRELLMVRRAVWPMREVVHALQAETHECFGEEARVYMRDVYDHIVQIIDVLETYRELGVELGETYMNVISNRMNEVIKVLTIIGTIFIPLTFLSGVYGMNMRIPEEQWAWAYPTFWAVCLLVAGGMLWWFRRKRWL